MKTEYFFTSSFNVFPGDLNHGNTLFGGKMLAEMDCEAAKVARSVIHGTGADGAVTAKFDTVDFLNPAKQGDLVVLEADVIKFGKTSMVISIDAYVWNGMDKKNWIKICSANATFVALKNGKPIPHSRELSKAKEELFDAAIAACNCVVKGYEGDGMEQMEARDDVFYEQCKNVMDRYNGRAN